MNQNFGDRWPDMATDNSLHDVMTASHPVVALHCSGANARQWRQLAATLGPCFNVIAPGLIGSTEATGWCGSHAFGLMDEAQAIIELIDELGQPVHIVGHSYGGGVALKIATEHPRHVASLALYEPSAFHILRQAGPEAREVLAEIEQLARAVGEGLVSGAYRQAAQEFVDYWNGHEAWATMRSELRDALGKWLPKAPLDFQALIMDDTPLDRIGRITCPVLLLRGEYARKPSADICDHLAELLPDQRTVVVAGAGHMGPISHADEVNDLVRAHLLSQLVARPEAQRLETIRSDRNAFHRRLPDRAA